MKKVLSCVALMVSALLILSGTTLSFAGDQIRDRDRTSEKLQDSSCQEGYTKDFSTKNLFAQYSGDEKGKPDAGDHKRVRDC